MQGVNPNAQGVDTVLYLHLAHSGSFTFISGSLFEKFSKSEPEISRVQIRFFGGFS